MKDLLSEAQEIIVEWQERDPPKKQRWAERQTSLNESWEEYRSMIFDAFLQATFPVSENVMCQRCMLENAVVRCNKCSCTQQLCYKCDQAIHESLPFHARDAVVNGRYLPIPSTTSRTRDGEWKIVGNK